MRVIITQNRDKSNVVINGQIASVHAFHNSTIFLELPNKTIVPIYQVTKCTNNENVTSYP